MACGSFALELTSERRVSSIDAYSSCRSLVLNENRNPLIQSCVCCHQRIFVSLYRFNLSNEFVRHTLELNMFVRLTQLLFWCEMWVTELQICFVNYTWIFAPIDTVPVD